jgi:ferric-dicitrate binding protein FerR (iron transport regulator)
VRRCSLPVLAELQVHAACQRREVAAASATLAGMTALAGVTAEKGGEALQNALASGIGQVFLGSLAGGPGVA